MEDAYVIGIRLALDNGVSAGIASIAADLRTLDAAIALTTTNLQHLQSLALGTGVGRPVGQGDRTPAATALEPAGNDPILAAPAQAPPTTAPPVAPAQGRASQPVVPARATLPATPASPPPAPIIRIMTPVSPPMIPLAPAPSTPPASPTASLPAASPISPDAGRVGRPRPDSEERDATAASAPSAPARAPVPSAAPAPSAPPAQRAAAPPTRMAAAAPSQSDNRSTAPSRPRAEADAQMPTTPAAPSYPAVQAAPPAREAQAGGMQGDVYLDGTRLGRWMSDRLARDAGRPQSGTTGFDPRLGPAWPGPLQGS